MSTQWTPEMVEANARKVAAGEAKARARRHNGSEANPKTRFASDIADMDAAFDRAPSEIPAKKEGNAWTRSIFASEKAPKHASQSRQDAVSAVLPTKTTKDSGQGVKFTIPGAVMGAPRMTRADAWKKRPCVLRYWAWKNASRRYVPPLPKDPMAVNWTAWLPMPKSWSDKKKTRMAGTLHRQKPDRDNIDKAVMDFLFSEDSGIACGTLYKLWDDGNGPRIEIEII